MSNKALLRDHGDMVANNPFFLGKGDTVDGSEILLTS